MTVPPSAGAPLPLEAEAWRAASAARSAPPVRSATAVLDTMPGQADRPRPATERQRLSSERLFADLAGQAGIPASRYSIGTQVDGALCLLPGGAGFQVFRSTGGSRRELQAFATEEAACFYLFGVLAAEALRTGSLVTRPAR